MSIIYDLDDAAAEIVDPSDGSPGVGPERGAYRQEGSSGHLFRGDDDADHRIGKVRGDDIARMSVSAIVRALKAQIDGGCVIAGRDYGCTSGLVAVDEIGNRFNDGPPPPAPPRRFRSRREARAAGPYPEVPLPPVDPKSPGARFSAAMARLAATPHPDGGTYADRVHVYVAPAMIAAVGKGLGRHHNLGRDGKPHFATWRGVLPGLARAGGVWLEMYHGYSSGATRAFSQWRTGPRDLVALLTAHGGDVGRVHFLLAATARPAGAPRGCRTAMACTWALAALPGVNRRILANGPGAYRVGGQAAEWVAQYNARMPGLAPLARPRTAKTRARGR